MTHDTTLPPRITLLVGSTGSGKSTLARKLATERGVLRFSIDEWMRALFWKDAPSPPSFEWAIERVHRCEAIIEGLLAQEIANGRGAILDLGFPTKAERARWRARCEALGATAQTIFLDVSREERWKRVEARNQTLASDAASIAVDRATFDWMEGHFEPLTEDERAGAVVLGG